MSQTTQRKSASLEKLLVRKGLREKKYFKELPVRRREKNKISKAKVNQSEPITKTEPEKNIIQSKIILGVS